MQPLCSGISTAQFATIDTVGRLRGAMSERAVCACCLAREMKKVFRPVQRWIRAFTRLASTSIEKGLVTISMLFSRKPLAKAAFSA